MSATIIQHTIYAVMAKTGKTVPFTIYKSAPRISIHYVNGDIFALLLEF
jgi:hypothetical protein